MKFCKEYTWCVNFSKIHTWSLESSGTLTGPKSCSVFFQERSLKSFENSTINYQLKKQNGLVKVLKSTYLIFKFNLEIWHWAFWVTGTLEKRAPDLTGDTVKFDLLAFHVLKNTRKTGTIVYASSVAFGFLGKQEKGLQIQRFSPPKTHTHMHKQHI